MGTQDPLTEMAKTPTTCDVIAILKACIAELGPATCRVGGTIEFSVVGADSGHWLLHLDAAGGRWVFNPGTIAAARANTHLRAVPDAFRLLVEPGSSLGPSLTSGALRVSGDAAKFSKLAQLIGAAGRPLSVRCGNHPGVTKVRRSTR